MEKKLKIIPTKKHEIYTIIERVFDFPNHINQTVIRRSILKKKLFYFFKNKKVSTIWSDNIKIGFVIKDKKKRFIFLDFFSYSFKYFKVSDLRYFKLFNKEEILDRSEYIKKNFSNKQLSNKEIEYSNTDKYKIRKILLLGPNQRNKKIKNKLTNRGYKVKILNEIINPKHLRENKYDFIISSGYPYKINNTIIKKYNKKIINLHATFLPWGKGIGTTFFSFLLNQPTGFSFHYIDKKFDTGKIICRYKLIEKKNDTTRTFYKRLLKKIESFFVKNIHKILENNLKGTNQKEYKIQSKYYSRDQFEKIIRLLPYGYDTKLSDLHFHSILIRKNIDFINFLIR